MSLVTAALAAAAATAAPAGVHQYDDLALAPRGDLVAAVESVETAGRTADPHGVLVIRRVADGGVVGQFDPCGDCRYGGPAWSPDGKALAFSGVDRKAGVATLFAIEGGRLRAVASLKGLIAKPRWAPDGQSLAVLATANAHKESGATSPGAARVGDIDSAPDERRIAVAPSAGGELRMVSPADRFVYEYDWTPDGRGFVATDAVGDGDNNWWVAELQAIDAAGGPARTIARPKVQMGFPRVSPDGRTVAFIGGIMSDFPVIGGDLYEVPFAGGEPTNVTPGFKGSFSSLLWTPKGLFATALVGDKQTLFSVAADGKLKALRAESASLSAGDARVALTPDARIMATMAQDFATAPRIAAGPIAAPKPITHDNDQLVANTEARSVSWTSGGFTVQGWLLAPKGVEAGKTYPMAVSIHGGPSSAVEPRFVWEGAT
ncbi:MAG TPA: S9 family peptidase, partial [Phenylobacterium sp.]|nr:S9 family peptidase [Phenylobacterium sp.]